MSDVLTFHPIGDHQIGAIVDLWTRCGLTRPWNDPVKDIAFARAHANSAVLAAEKDGVLCASVMVGHDGHRGAVYYVSVDPAFRGRGYGRQVMRAAESWLIARGVWKLNLNIRSDNAEAQAFYQQFGYEVEPVISMARRLV